MPMHKKIFSMHGFFYTSFKKVEYFSKKVQDFKEKEKYRHAKSCQPTDSADFQLLLPQTYQVRIDVLKEYERLKKESMEQHLNRIELRGRVGTVRTNEVNGTKVANFSVVTEHLYKTREGNAVSETTWFNVTA